MSNYPKLGTGTVSKIYPNMDAAVTTSTPRPYDLPQMDATALQKEAWADGVKVLNTLDDIFEVGMSDVKVTYANEGVSLPGSIGMKLQSGGANITHTFPVLNPLLGSVISGTDNDLVSHEMGQDLSYFTAYYAEEKAGVMTEQYGIKFNQVNEFAIYQKATNQLSKLFAETSGRQKRECLTQYYNIELNSAGSGVASKGQHYNPNWMIANSTDVVAGKVDGNGMPIWSSNKETFGNNIGTALDAAATGTNGVNANISIRMLDKFSALAHEKYIEPTEDGKFIIVLPLPQWYKLSAILAGQMGEVWTSVNRYGAGAPTFPGEVGTYRDLRIIADERWASLVTTESTGTYSHTFEYVQPGGAAADGREKGLYTYTGSAGDRIWQLGWLCGKSAYIERVEKELFFKEEEQEYGKRKGIGAFTERGCNLTVIRKGAETGTAGFPDVADNRGSAVLAFSGAIA